MKQLSTILVFALMCILCSCEEPALEGNNHRCADGSERTYFHPEIDWASLDGHPEKIEACQIPANILPGLSTAELVELLAEYPLLIEAHAFNTFAMGVDAVLRNFNGATELLSRKDNIQKMAIYFDKHKKYVGKKEDKGMHSLTQSVMMMAAVRDEMLDNATSETLEKLHADALEVLGYQLEDEETYGTFSIATTMHVLLKVHDRGDMSPAIDNEKALLYIDNTAWEYCSKEDYKEALEFCKSLK